MGSSIKAFTKVLGSNLIVMFFGILTTLIFPKYLGPYEYGEYQLYLFYASFLGFFLLGYCDGLYLRYGGIEYSMLDKGSLSKDFKFINFYLVCISLIFYIIIMRLGIVNQKINLLLSISIFLQGVNSFFVLINQASGRFNVFSLTNIIEKLILTIYGAIVFITGEISIDWLFFIVIGGKAITLMINIVFDIDIVKSKTSSFSTSFFSQIIMNIKSGLPLTISGISSMLITGFGRSKVQNNLGNEQFGIYSLVFSLMSIVTQIISAISIVFYPFLKNSDNANLKANLQIVDKWFVFIGLFINLMYFPMFLVLKFYLHQYLGASSCLFILLPTLVCQARISILYNTYYKVLRKESLILLNGMFTLIVSVVLTTIFFNMSSSIESVALATLISFLFWERISKNNLYKIFESKSGVMDNIDEILFPLIFVGLNFLLDSFIAFLLYLLIVIAYIIFNRKNIYEFYYFIFKKRT